MKNARSALRRIVPTVVLAALLAACGSGDEQRNLTGVPDEVYVQVMTELLLLDSSPPDGSTPEEREAKADSVRGEILASHGVGAKEMLDFARTVGGESDRMEGLWQRITQRYDSARISDLRRDTEARSEAEGKLGEEARTGAGPSTASGASSLGRKPAADSLASPEAGSPVPRSARDGLKRPAKARPAARDTAVPRGG
jgi:hypothetical protein